MVPILLLSLLPFRRNNYAKTKKNHHNHFQRIWPYGKKPHLLKSFLGRHGSPYSYRTLCIKLEIYPGQKDWFPRIRANIALIGIGCWKFSTLIMLIFCRKNQFSWKLLDKNQWNFKRRNYLILSFDWFQSCCWAFCRLGAIILQK